MDVVALSPFRTGRLLWQPRPGIWVLTVICKATFQLQPTECVLAVEQEGPTEEDSYWNDDVSRSLRAASDLVPSKPRADVVVEGHAFAPGAGATPVRSLVVRLRVGDIDKSIEVFSDRSFSLDGTLHEGPRFTRMPLVYERAAGGPDTANPVGVPRHARNTYGNVAIPNLQPTGMVVHTPSEFIEPIGFGPIAPSWPSRRDKLGRHAAGGVPSSWHEVTLPEDIDYSFFNVAPRDQQLEAIRPNERIVLEHLHPDHPRLVTSLPGIRPRVVLERSGAAPEELAMPCDTLCIDTDRAICTLAFRARIPLAHPAEPGRVLVAMEGPGRTLPIAENVGMAGAPQHRSGAAAIPAVGRGGLPTVRWEGGDEDKALIARLASAVVDDGTGTISIGGMAPREPALPFAAAAEDPAGERRAGREAAARQSSLGGLPFSSAQGPTATPVGNAPKVQEVTPLSQPVPQSQPAPSAQPPAPPPMVRAPILMDSSGAPAPIAPPIASSPWAAGANLSAADQATAISEAIAPIESMPGGRPLTFERAPSVHNTPLVAQDLVVKKGWKPIGARSSDSGSKAGAIPIAKDAALGGAVDASNAAAATERVSAEHAVSPAKTVQASSGLRPKHVIELLWFEPAAVARIRRQPVWKEIIAQVKPRPLDDDFPGEAPPEKRQELRDRREVFGLLARGEPTDMDGVNTALVGAVGEDGTFVPPLVLVAGELEFPFDELETLKATIAAVTPLIAGDKKLKETVDTTQELLQTPWLKGASGVAEGLTAKLKEVFAQGNRVLPGRYLETHTERMLLEQRAYQKRTVLGKVCIRSLLSQPGVHGGVPVYLPESLGQELPSFPRLAVKLLAEARVQVDYCETHPIALRAVAVGRVLIGLGKR